MDTLGLVVEEERGKDVKCDKKPIVDCKAISTGLARERLGFIETRNVWWIGRPAPGAAGALSATGATAEDAALIIHLTSVS